MPTYNVAMGQAVTVIGIADNMLMTGRSVASGLMSCSAIILYNRATANAGLFHYPSGNINKRAADQRVLAEMVRDIMPTDCHLIYGTVDLVRNPFDFSFPDDAHPSDEYHDELVMHLRSLGLRPRIEAAIGGRCATVSCPAGVWTVGRTQPDGRVEDLSGHTLYPDNMWLKIYWSMREPDTHVPPPRPRPARPHTCVIL